jgi:lysophospholipase L1-like esterase
MPVPQVVIVAPPPIQNPRGPIAPKFEGAAQLSAGVAAALASVAADEQCPFFDAGTVTASSLVDGVHLDADQHAALGRALARFVQRLL